MGGSDVHDLSYYSKCMVGGILSCGITHMLVCPLDIVKCRMQVSTLDFILHYVMLFRQTLECTKTSETVSDKSKQLKASKDSLS